MVEEKVFWNCWGGRGEGTGEMEGEKKNEEVGYCC